MNNLFYYTELKVEGENTTTVTGFSFNMDDVILTYPETTDKDELVLNIVLSMGSDKLNPVEYQYKTDPKTKQRYPVKVSKFEITNEPILVQLKLRDEINKFFSMTGGPEW